MAIINDYVKGMQVHHDLGGRAGYLYNELDFSVKNVAGADVVEALKVNAGMVIMDLRVEVITAEGGTATAGVGDGDDTTGYDAAISLEAAAFLATTKGTDNYAVGRRYAADDTIDIIPSEALDNCKLKIWAMYVRMD